MTRFVTFEGIEGCGKTTQIRLAAAWLAERGIPVLATAEPGGTPLSLKIREILLNRGSCPIGAEAELLLFAAARAQHVRETILPALGRGSGSSATTRCHACLPGFGGTRRRSSRLNDFPPLLPDKSPPWQAGLARASAAGAAWRLNRLRGKSVHGRSDGV